MSYADLQVSEINVGCRFKVFDNTSTLIKIKEMDSSGDCLCFDETKQKLVKVNGYATVEEYP